MRLKINFFFFLFISNFFLCHSVAQNFKYFDKIYNLFKENDVQNISIIKNAYEFQTFTFILVANFVYAQSSDLILQGVLDLDLPTGAFTGKATHLVATNNISDLSIYGLGTASNGGGSDSVELTLPAISVNAGDDILLARDTNAIHLYFGSCFNSFEVIIPVVTTGVAAVSQNGNDAIELFISLILFNFKFIS